MERTGGSAMALRAFTEHPASVGETWFGHFLQATRFGVRLVAGGLACLVHAVFPFLFVKTGSKLITELHDCMVANRDRRTRELRSDRMQAPTT